MNPWGALFAASVRSAALVLAAAYLVWFAGRCIAVRRNTENEQ